uniref:Ribosomal protein S13 n=2 Tax=Mycena chlorophos TaxID=658473 RepID=A0ABQ0L4E6_MYCCL|nr:ribosomal protein S13 [Mycena chlorophos]
MRRLRRCTTSKQSRVIDKQASTRLQCTVGCERVDVERGTGGAAEQQVQTVQYQSHTVLDWVCSSFRQPPRPFPQDPPKTQPNMGRMHAPGKGISSSALPYRRAPPTWLKTTPEEVVEHIVKLARKGLTPSQIGVTLRDSHGIPQVRFLTGNKILRILKGQGLGPSVPEDLWHLIKKAVAVRKHLETNRKDKDSKFRLILIESRIHRLARYYKTKQQIPPTFKYDSATASTLIA